MRWTLLLCVLGLAGCTHLKGIVLVESTQRPARTAVLSIGRPTGIAVFATHHVDANGAFDFYIGPTDENHVYIYDDSGSPELTMRRIDPLEMSVNMTLHLRPPAPGTPALPAGSLNYP